MITHDTTTNIARVPDNEVAQELLRRGLPWCDGVVFLDDDDMAAQGNPFDETKFVQKYRRWEMKDTNEEVDDIELVRHRPAHK